MKRVVFFLVFLALALAAGDKAAYLERLEWAWRLVKDVYYRPDIGGVDWDAIGERYHERAKRVESWAELYELIAEMYAEIGDDHTSFIPPWKAFDMELVACYPLPYPEAWEKPVPKVEPPKDFEAEEGGFWERASYRLEDGVLYLRLPNLVLPENYEIIAEAIAEHEDEVAGYVLDLRGNPGGLVQEMARTAGLFFRGWPWRMVLRGVGAVPQPTMPFFGEPPAKKPLAVIIDKNVHSAAEGLAGALADSGRAFLVGERTAGNTEALMPYCFPEGAVALVAAGVLAPSRGPTWEGRGVSPDLPLDPDEALKEAISYVKGTKRQEGKEGRSGSR